MSQVAAEGNTLDGRYLSRYLPLDVAILSVIEFVLSFTVIIFTLDPPLAAGSLSIVNPLTEGTVSTTFAGGDLAAILRLQHRRGRNPDHGAPLARILPRPQAPVQGRLPCRDRCSADVSLMRGELCRQHRGSRSLVDRTIGVWLAIIAPYRLLFTFTVRQTRATRRFLIVGDTTRVNAVSARLLSRRGRRFEQLVIRHGAVAGPAATATGLGRRRRIGRRILRLRTAAGLQAARDEGDQRQDLSGTIPGPYRSRHPDGQ